MLDKPVPNDKFIGNLSPQRITAKEAAKAGRTRPNRKLRNAQPAALNLVKYDGGYFSVMLPEGWRIQTMGQYTTLVSVPGNPNNRNFEIFYYGNLSPLLKSHDAKANWANYINQGGYPNARLYADAPAD